MSMNFTLIPLVRSGVSYQAKKNLAFKETTDQDSAKKDLSGWLKNVSDFRDSKKTKEEEKIKKKDDKKRAENSTKTRPATKPVEIESDKKLPTEKIIQENNISDQKPELTSSTNPFAEKKRKKPSLAITVPSEISETRLKEFLEEKSPTAIYQLMGTVNKKDRAGSYNKNNNYKISYKRHNIYYIYGLDKDQKVQLLEDLKTKFPGLKKLSTEDRIA